MEFVPPERPNSTPPDLNSGTSDGQEKSSYLNPAFSHEEPIFTSNGGTGFDFSNSSNANHLIFRTTRSSKFPAENGHIFSDGGTQLRHSDSEYKRHSNKYATTRIPASKQSSKWLEGMTSDAVLRPSKTVGRQSGRMYIRAGQKQSPRRQISSNSGAGQGPGGGGGGGGAIFPGAGTIFRRSVTERKESCFAFFDIETDKVGSYQYRPGEEISGIIKIIVRKAVEIRYVELVVLGQGYMTLKKSRESLPPQNITETYLSKQRYIIGSGDAAWTSVLTPGHYTSKFRVKLPADLPSTLHHSDARNGISFDIDYTLRARICDDARPKMAHHSTAQQGLVKVLLSKKVGFNVQRAFDISQIPDAMAPVSHSEQVYLSCAQTDPAVIALTVDRAVCQAGDDVRLSLNAALPPSHNVKDITCDLQEHIHLDRKHVPLTFTLSRMIRKDPSQVAKAGQGQEHHRKYKSRQHHQRQSPRPREGEESTFEVTLPTHTGLISPYSLSTDTSKLSITYSLNIVLRISRAGGKISFNVPLDIGPCAEPIYAEKISSRKAVPLFNRPTRFPCFSSPTPPTPSSLSRQPSAQGSRSALVKTEYTNSCFARCFLCCVTATDD